MPTETQESAEVWIQMTACTRKLTKNNKPYLDVQLADGEQSITIKIWEDKPWFHAFSQYQPRTFLSITGLWSKNAYGSDVTDVAVRMLTDDERELLFLGSPELKAKQEHDYQTIVSMVGSIQDPRLHGICVLFLSKLEERFKRSAAARGFHHARRGGLVEHIAGMMRAAQAICTAYSQLNSDLLLAGCLLHDCGKLWENNYGTQDFTMPFTETAELMGHIPLGIELTNNLWREIMQSPTAQAWMTIEPPSAEVRLHLLHMIASHHGELAFGSPVPPKTPEAITLHYIDNLDAKLEMFQDAYATSELIGEGVYAKRVPLAGNEVRPLAHFHKEPLAKPSFTDESEPVHETLL